MRSIWVLSLLLVTTGMGAARSDEPTTSRQVSSKPMAPAGAPGTITPSTESTVSTDSVSHFVVIIFVISVSGAIGGFVLGINGQRANEIVLPFNGRSLQLGCVGDMLIGMAASLAIHFAADPILEVVTSNGVVREYRTKDYLRAISLGVISGFAGIKVLSSMSTAFMSQLLANQKELDRKVKTSSRTDELVIEGEKHVEEGDLENARLCFQRALDIDSTDVKALVGKAKVLKRQALAEPQANVRRTLLDQAIDTLTTAIHVQSDYDRAYYNRACYKNLIGDRSKDEVLADLRTAISLFEQFKSLARIDEDFKNLRNDDDFKQIVK